ncbi:MAG: hypothetical protein KY428_08025 [Bacteroidetes bacterium]|nr:hypothetical protein [Bacteroidota bacterium]
MKNLYTYTCLLLLMAMFACEPIEEREELMGTPDKSQLAFSIEQNPARPNELWLSSSTPGVIPFWDFETGVSNQPQDTVLIPFEGDFWVKYYAYAGGVPAVDSVQVSFEQDEEFFSTPEWNLLTNGAAGKTWVWAFDNPRGVVMGIGSYNPDNWDPLGGFEWWSTNDVEEGKFMLDLDKGFNYTKITPSGTVKGNFSLSKVGDVTYIRFQGPKMLNQEADNTQSLYAIGKITEDELIINQLYDWGGQRTYYFKREGFNF